MVRPRFRDAAAETIVGIDGGLFSNVVIMPRAAQELLLMRVAERKLQPDDLVRAFDRYKKLTQATARNILRFYEQRVERRAQSRTTPVIPVQEEVRTIVSR